MKITNDNNGRIEIYTPYNENFIAVLKKRIGGRKWNSEKNCWTAPEKSIEAVRDLMMEYFGETDISTTKKVKVELFFEKNIESKGMCITIFGKTVARAYSSRSTASLSSDVIYKDGRYFAAGSNKYPYVEIEQNSIVILSNVPETIIKSETLPEGVTYNILRQQQSEHALKQERKRLMERIKEIDEELKKIASC